MRLLHDPAKVHTTFDDPNLVSRAGLVPVMALAQRAGLPDLVAEHVRIARSCGVNAHLKVSCLAAGMIAGADSIDDMDLLRHGPGTSAGGARPGPAVLSSGCGSGHTARAAVHGPPMWSWAHVRVRQKSETEAAATGETSQN